MVLGCRSCRMHSACGACSTPAIICACITSSGGSWGPRLFSFRTLKSEQPVPHAALLPAVRKRAFGAFDFTGTVHAATLVQLLLYNDSFSAPSRLGIIGSVENLLSVVRLMCSSLLATCPSPHTQAWLGNILVESHSMDSLTVCCCNS